MTWLISAIALGLVCTALVVLKLAGLLTLPWVWVLAPVWVTVFVVLLAFLGVLLLGSLFRRP